MSRRWAEMAVAADDYRDMLDNDPALMEEFLSFYVFLHAASKDHGPLYRAWGKRLVRWADQYSAIRVEDLLGDGL